MMKFLLLVVLVGLFSCIQGHSTKILRDPFKLQPVPQSPPSARSLSSSEKTSIENALAANLYSYKSPSMPSAVDASHFDLIDSSNEESLEDAKCSLCQLVASGVAPFISKNSTVAEIKKVATGICELLKIQCTSAAGCETMCNGLIESNAPIVVDVLVELLTPQAICYALKQCSTKPSPPGPRPGIPVPSNLNNSAGVKQWPSWAHTTGSGFFIQLTDIHYDFEYAAGSSNDCGLPMCCRAANGFPSNPSQQAGIWGDYQCDTALPMLDAAFAAIAAMDPKPDFILYNGDSPPHDIWSQSRAENLQVSSLLAQLFVANFPDVPVVMAVGNHEVYPVNQYRGPGYDSWLYGSLLKDYAYYLAEDAQHTFAYGGYYQTLIRPGLRALVLNDNYFCAEDFYLAANRSDIASQLPWMVDVLLQVRQRGEKVLIMGHTRQEDWEAPFVYEYHRIITSYKDVIVGQFWGHTHTGSLVVNYDVTAQSNGTLGSTPSLVNFVGGSITPFTGLNSGFTSYAYDRQAFKSSAQLVTDFQLYYSVVSDTNQFNKSDFATVRLSALKDFGLQSLAPEQIAALAQNQLTDANLYHNLLVLHYKGNIPSDNGIGQHEMYCTILTPSHQEYKDCMKAKFNKIVDSKPKALC